MPGPRISVLMPARNAAATVRAAAHGVLGQTLGDLELVVVDDGSTDGTGDEVARLAREDERVQWVRTPPRGLVAALREGLSLCRAGWIARMDADDVALPERLASSVAALEADPRLAAVGTQVEIFREDRPVSPNLAAYAAWLNSLVDPDRLLADSLVESPLCHPSVTLRREALEAVGGWEDGDFPEDYHLWLKLLAAGYRLRVIAPVLLRWRDHDQRLTRTDGRYSLRRHLWLRAHHLARTTLLAERACAVWGAGEVGLALSRFLRAEGVAIERFIDVNPRKVGMRIQGIPVVGPEALGPPGVRHLVVAVGAKGARAEIRAHLASGGWSEVVHYTCCA